MPTIFSNRTLLSTYEYDMTAVQATGSWTSFNFTATQINGSTPPIAGSEIVLYYLVSASNLGSNPSVVGVDASGSIKFTLNGTANSTTTQSFSVNGGVVGAILTDGTVYSADNLTIFQYTTPLSGSYIYVWLSHDVCGHSCQFTLTLASTSSGGANYPDITDDTVDHFIGIDQPTPRLTLDVAGRAYFGTGSESVTDLSNIAASLIASVPVTAGIASSLAIINSGDGGGGAGAAVDFYNYALAYSYDPAVRLVTTDDGGYGSNFSIQTKQEGYPSNPLIDRIYVQGPTGYVGIANNNPSYNLDVTGVIHCTGQLITDSGAMYTDGSGNLTATSVAGQNLQLYDTGLGRFVTITSVNGVLSIA